MNLIFSNKIEVKNSHISGRGVFAKEDIEINEIIEECHHITLDNSFNYIDNKLKEYVFSWPKNVYNGKSTIVLGWGSIYNHSNDNNADWVTDENKNVFRFYAIKKIKKGEEIFTNYGEAYVKTLKTVN